MSTVLLRPAQDPQRAMQQNWMVQRAKTLFDAFNPRKPKATGYEYTRLPDGRYHVYSILHAPNEGYVVDLERGTCTCPEYSGIPSAKGGWVKTPRRECKHLIGLSLHLPGRYAP